MNSTQIINLLKDKHCGDIFVDECKSGSTWMNNTHSRIDAWVMKKSWAHSETIGYEVKVSRSDFQRDGKYVNYLAMCNSLYFVCPWKMIEVSELPLEVGLIYVSKNGTSLITRKKAVKRDIEDLSDVYKYVLMSRCKIVTSGFGCNKDDYWKRFAEDKDNSLDIGKISSKKIRKLLTEEVFNVRNEMKSIQKKAEDMQEQYNSVAYAVEFLKSIGIDPNSYNRRSISKYNIEREISEKIKPYLGDISEKLMVAKNIVDEIIKKGVKNEALQNTNN